MNYLRVHAAAKKKFLANRDIYGLLKNGRHRRTKKIKGPVPAKKYGILSKSLSFKVVLNAEKGGDPAEKEIIVIPIRRVQQFNKSKQTKEKKKKTPAKRKNDAVHQTKKVQAPVPEPIPMKINNLVHDSTQTMNFVPENTNQREVSSFSDVNNLSQVNHNKVTETIQTIPSNFNELNELSYKTPVGIAFDQLTQSNETEHKMLSFDSVIVPDLQDQTYVKLNSNIDSNFDGSVGFTSVQNQLRTIDTNTPLDFPSIQTHFSSKKNSSDKTNDSGWSLNTPDISQTISLNSQTSIESLGSLVNSEESQQDQTFHHQSLTQSPFTPAPVQTNVDYNSNPFPTTFNRNNNEDPSWQVMPKLTMEMVIERKQLGARRSLDRLFGVDRTSVQRSTSTNRSSTINTQSNTFDSERMFTINLGKEDQRNGKRHEERKLQPTSTLGSFNTHLGANPSVTTFKKQSKEIPVLTMRMVKQRKRLAARHALDRLFRERYTGSTSMQTTNNDSQRTDTTLQTLHSNSFNKSFLSFV